MAFLNKIRSLPLPPVKNVLNVAMQTARQNIPGQNKSEYEQPHGPPKVPPRPQSVRFADQQGRFVVFIEILSLQKKNHSVLPDPFSSLKNCLTL